MTSTRGNAASRSSRLSWQFGLSTLMAGMFVAAIFFGYSGLWWRRVLEERERSAAVIRRLEADLLAEKQTHRETQARLLVAQSQLQDALGEQIGQQIADRAAAERELRMVEQYAARLRAELEAARKEAEQLRLPADGELREDGPPEAILPDPR